MIIGTFHRSGDGYAGRLRTIGLDVSIVIVAAQSSDAANAPAWRLLLGDAEQGVEIGAGWNRTGERASTFIAVRIDDPAFPAALRANLLRSLHDDDEYHLVWSRPSGRGRD